MRAHSCATYLVRENKKRNFPCQDWKGRWKGSTHGFQKTALGLKVRKGLLILMKANTEVSPVFCTCVNCHLGRRKIWKSGRTVLKLERYLCNFFWILMFEETDFAHGLEDGLGLIKVKKASQFSWRPIRPVVPGCAIAYPDFGRSVNPTSTRGNRSCPPNYYWHTRIFRPSDATALRR